MKVAIFSTHNFELPFLDQANLTHRQELKYISTHLSLETVKLAEGCTAISAFVGDVMNQAVLEQLARQGTKFIALRSAGYNHIDLQAAAALGIRVARVPAYSPNAVAEHAVALMLALNRKLYKAYNRVRDGNFNLDGLLGFDFCGKTVGVIGTGKIGSLVAKIMTAFDCKVLAYDIEKNQDCVKLGAEYVTLDKLIEQSDVISLHCPLTAQTRHMINAAAVEMARPGVMIINTSRGALVDTRALIQGLKTGKIGYVGLDVYEEEEALFFEDHSNKIIDDDVFSRLLTFPNVMITGHQGFFTENALENIAETTMQNLCDFAQGGAIPNEVRFG